MHFSSKLDQLHYQARQNRWLGYFAIFNRIALAVGFLPSGFVKIMGERFTDLHNNQPMGHYLEALHHTGYYYTFIGIAQVTAAILLLIPRTALLGALIYFPIILNIFILSLAVRFGGSLLSSPLMILANLYLLCWDYHKLKFILPFNSNLAQSALPKRDSLSYKFPIKFFAGVAATIFIVVFSLIHAFDIMPRNTLSGCERQCNGSSNAEACCDFCECIHTQGQPLGKCLSAFNEAEEDGRRTKQD